MVVAVAVRMVVVVVIVVVASVVVGGGVIAVVVVVFRVFLRDLVLSCPVLPCLVGSCFENKRFDLGTLRVPSRSPTPISKSNDFLGQSEDIWGPVAPIPGRFGGLPGSGPA